MKHILHVDINAFYASCEQAKNPDYLGKPVIVAGNPETRHGIVLTASYEARKFGVKTGMVNWQAQALCPKGIFVRPDFDTYMDFSQKVINILKSFSPLVEQFSIDEAWVDVTGCESLLGSPFEIAVKIQKKIANVLKLPCSVGISENKLLAKMASDMKKPNGIVELYLEDVRTKIWPLPIKDLIWIGSKRQAVLNNIGIYTIGQLATLSIDFLKKLFGINGKYIYYFANGIDNSPVRPDYMIIKSFGNSITLPRDYNTLFELQKVLLSLSELIGTRMRSNSYMFKTVSLTLKDSNFNKITRTRTLNFYSFLTEDIYNTSVKILKEIWNGQSIRLIGLSVSNLYKYDGNIQLSLFYDKKREKLEKLNTTIDSIRKKHGEDSIIRASLLIGDRVKQIAPLWGMKNYDPR